MLDGDAQQKSESRSRLFFCFVARNADAFENKPVTFFFSLQSTKDLNLQFLPSGNDCYSLRHRVYGPVEIVDFPQLQNAGSFQFASSVNVYQAGYNFL